MDVTSLQLSRADGIGSSVTPWAGPPGPDTAIADVATPASGGEEECPCTTDGPDGLDDVLVHFATPEVAVALELFEVSGGTDLELCLSGTLIGGTPFEVCDCVLRVPPHANAMVSASSEVFIELGPPDLFDNAGGVGILTRWYQPNTLLTVTAPAQSSSETASSEAVVALAWAGQIVFHHWVVDGVMQPAGQRTVTVTVTNWNQPRNLYAVYGTIVDDGDRAASGAQPGAR